METNQAQLKLESQMNTSIDQYRRVKASRNVVLSEVNADKYHKTGWNYHNHTPKTNSYKK